ncbi:zinc finger matrin-type protein 5 isoform X2 [Malurus melanocephalus]|uniref:zinc finger matrin-type protein 5 isoform X2 n=1 Tax=Malurus melanocephalus TaxID=175006 RepID=UPI002548F42D|nr:zinc finger matrin-type protein 5 isoform X2 [Malurus melanocephalus]
MGKRYFCDYCDRSFQDNLHNRKKHLNGVQHLRAKRVWYDLFRGQCDFGSNCRFSHMTEQDLEKLNAQVQGEKRLKELQREGADIPPGTIEDWLDKRAQRLSVAQSNSALPEKPAPFQYPPGWPPVQELPPSLQAPPPGGWPVPPNLQWG